jgi:hypothetical protein
MPRFRPTAVSSSFPGDLRALMDEVLRPAHFFLGPSVCLEWEHVATEDTSWEIFLGRLLDPAHTRQRRTFAAWNVYQIGTGGRSAEPILSLKLDAAVGELHVVRGLECYVWEGYDSGGSVYLSRERRKWVRELVGTIRLTDFPDLGELADEIICFLFHAVIGTSRLPLSSVEAPLPSFSFGNLFYCYRPDSSAADGALRSWRDLARFGLAAPLSSLVRTKLLETFLHAVPFTEMQDAAEAFVAAWPSPLRGADLTGLLRTLFNEVSLSPYTDLVDKTLAFVAAREKRGSLTVEERIDFLGHLLRQVGRHLTAYDLVTFHHRGANYPDALLLDAVLKDYLLIAEEQPDLFSDRNGDGEEVRQAKRLRRRALRQGWLLRRHYEGHPVPDSPTSPGENNRVLPASHPRVPEEQLLQTNRRTKCLYADDPLPNHLGPQSAHLLRQSIVDLRDQGELHELGIGLFIDRPLGDGKAPGEPDGTLLLTSVAFSRSVAAQRLGELAADPAVGIDLAFFDACRSSLANSPVRGLPSDEIGEPSRPGTISLTDARRAAADFVFLRTTAGSVKAFLKQFDFAPLAQRFNLDFLNGSNQVLLARRKQGPGLMISDAELRPRLELMMNAAGGYAKRTGKEYPRDGLSAIRVWDDEKGGFLKEWDLRETPIFLRPLAP